MSMAIVFAAAYAALAALALSMARHRDQVASPGRDLAPRTVLALRLAGWGLLALALAPALAAWGVAVGILAWLGLITFAALAVGLQLTYAPRSAAWSAPAAGGLGALLSVLALAAGPMLR